MGEATRQGVIKEGQKRKKSQLGEGEEDVGEGRKAGGGRVGRGGEREGDGRKLSLPRSFLKVGAYKLQCIGAYFDQSRNDDTESDANDRSVSDR